MQMSGHKQFANMLATDLDGTLVGDDQACKATLAWMQQNLNDFGLVYITGRHYYSVLELMEERNLPTPDLLVTDVGTEIHLGSSTTIDSDWQQRMQSDWKPDIIRQLATEIPGIRQQNLPVACRVSFYADNEKAAEMLRQKLEEAKISFTYIFSSQRDVDILPAGGGKGEALKYIALKYAKNGASILAAGDSGNDIAMLTAGFPGVIVGNSQQELIDLPASPLLYKAQNNYASGIFEGWIHFFSPDNNGN